MPCYFVGIAWDSGNAFTYRIWTCPEGKELSQGHELVRNTVKSRNDSVGRPTLSKLELEFVTRKRSRKRKRSKVVPVVDDDEPPPMIERTDRLVSLAPDVATLVPHATTPVAHAMDPEEPGERINKWVTTTISIGNIGKRPLGNIGVNNRNGDDQ